MVQRCQERILDGLRQIGGADPFNEALNRFSQMRGFDEAA